MGMGETCRQWNGGHERENEGEKEKARLMSGQEWKAIPILTRIEYREEDGNAFLRDPTSPDL